jgi:DNA gyrase subunit B
MQNSYDGSSVKVLKGLEAVRKRPGMYIGDTDDGSGLHHMIYEVVDNAIDEALAGYCDEIHIDLNIDGSVTVKDNGRGIPVDMHPTEGRSTLEVVMTELHAGGKFDQNSYKVAGGLHGVGVSVVNALSNKLEVRVFRNNTENSITFENGVVSIPLSTGPECGDITGTEVTFWPSPKIFSTIEFSPSIVEKRLRELAFLNSGVRIIFDDKNSDKDPIKLFYDGGVEEFVKYIDKARKSVLSKPIVATGEKTITTADGEATISVEASLTWNEGYSESVLCFTNNIPQKDGGAHLTGLRGALTHCVGSYAEKNLQNKKKINLSGDDIREGMTAVLSIKMPNPKFSSQTKEKLVSSEVTSAVQSIVSEFMNNWLEENPSEAKTIIGKAAEAAVARAAARKARELTRKNSKLEISNLAGKLKDCTEKDPRKTELFIVEGDSAGGSAQVGRSRQNQAILPLRGKVLNTERARLDKILKSEQIGTLINALGCGIGADGFDPEKLRYHKIIIMTDADVDGSHIRALLLTLFFRYMPELVERGHIYIAQPPLFSVAKGNGAKTYMLDEDSLSEHLIKIGIEDISLTTSGGEVLSGEKLREKINNERNLISKIEIADGSINCLPLTTALAVTGAWHPAAWMNTDKTQKSVDYICSIMPARMPKTKWSGTVIDGNMQFTYRQRGVDNTVTVKSDIVNNNAVKYLLGEFEGLSKSYENGSTLKSVGIDEVFYGPKSMSDFILNKGNKGLTTQRYKGLGEMNPDQLWETTLNPQNRNMTRVLISDKDKSDILFSTLMGDVVEPRKDYIVENSIDVQNIDI